MASVDFNPFENLVLAAKFCSRPCAQSLILEEKNYFSLEFITALKSLDIDYDANNSPESSCDYLFDVRNRPTTLLLSCNDCVNFVEACVPRKIMKSLDAGKLWDFEMYRRDVENKHVLIRLRFRSAIERVVKELPNQENRRIKKSKKNDPYKSFLANTIGNKLEFLRKALRTCQTRQKALSMFRNAVLKVVWDFHIKNNEPWRYIMFYWKIVVDQELRLPPSSTNSATDTTTEKTKTTYTDDESYQEQSQSKEPFHSLIVVAKKYVDSVGKRTTNVDEFENDNDFRVPDHYDDEDQEKFYKFYDNYIAGLVAESANGVYGDFRRRTYEAVETYGKNRTLDEKTSVDDKSTVTTVSVTNKNGTMNQSFMKKRVQRMGLVPLTDLDSLTDSRKYSSSVNDLNAIASSPPKEPLIMKKNSFLIPPSALTSPTYELRKKLSLPDVRKSSSSSSSLAQSNRKKEQNSINKGNQPTRKWSQIQIAVPRIHSVVSNVKSDPSKKNRKITVTPEKLNDIIERLRRPLDRSVKSRALRQLLKQEQANLAKKRFKPEREVLQMVERLSAVSEKPSFDYSVHIDFAKTLRKYDIINTVFRGGGKQKYIDRSDDEDGGGGSKLLKNRKSTNVPRVYGSNRSINEDTTDYVTIEQVRPRTQSQKFNVD